MKKIILCVAIVLAGVLSSCGDTNYCYELTATINVLGVSSTQTSYVWGTSNELDAAIEETKAALVESGLSEDAVTITYKKVKKSESDCM